MDDLISRQAAIDALASYRDYRREFVSAENWANRLKKNAEVADYDK